MVKCLWTNLQFWHFYTCARCEYSFTCLTSLHTPDVMLKTSNCNVSWVSTLYWMQRERQQCVFKRTAVLFLNFSCKNTDFTSASQGVLTSLFAKPKLRWWLLTVKMNFEKGGELAVVNISESCSSYYINWSVKTEHCWFYQLLQLSLILTTAWSQYNQYWVLVIILVRVPQGFMI